MCLFCFHLVSTANQRRVFRCDHRNSDRALLYWRMLRCAGHCSASLPVPSLSASCRYVVYLGHVACTWLGVSERVHYNALHGGGLRHAVLELGDWWDLHTDVHQWVHARGLWRLHVRGGHAWRRLADLHRRGLSRKLGWHQCGHGLHLRHWLHRCASSS